MRRHRHERRLGRERRPARPGRCRLGYSDELHQFVPADLAAGIFAAGRVNGVYRLEDQVATASAPGSVAARHVGKGESTGAEVHRHPGPAPSHPYPVFAHPKGKAFVDLDEDVQLKDIDNAIQEGFDNIELVKRYTTFGMGPSQGKHSNMNGIRILARLMTKTIEETGTTTSRPFYHPVPMGMLAGRGFHPAAAPRCTAGTRSSARSSCAPGTGSGRSTTRRPAGGVKTRYSPRSGRSDGESASSTSARWASSRSRDPTRGVPRADLHRAVREAGGRDDPLRPYDRRGRGDHRRRRRAPGSPRSASTSRRPPRGWTPSTGR